MIDGLGGLPGVLSLVGTALLKAFGPQVATGIASVANGVRSLTPSGRAALQEEKMAALNALKTRGTNSGIEGMEASNLARRAEVA
jgi:hypothetical protein